MHSCLLAGEHLKKNNTCPSFLKSSPSLSLSLSHLCRLTEATETMSSSTVWCVQLSFWLSAGSLARIVTWHPYWIKSVRLLKSVPLVVSLGEVSKKTIYRINKKIFKGINKKLIT